ncbi:MAG: DUF2232 domain-containing protein [Tissierellia bacterium]|nr:DUF2232 domain-containing protein [Tissierellia bacterium]
MNSELNNRNSEIIRTLVLTTILALFGMYYFPFIMFLYPVMFIVLGVRHGARYSLMGLLASASLLGLIVDIISGILMFIAFMPLTLIIINSIVRRRKATKTLLYSTIAFLVSVIMIVSFVNMNGVSVIGQLKGNITQIVNSQMDLLGQLNLTKEQVAEIRNLQGSYLEIVLAVIPSVIIIFSLVISYLNYLISSLLLRNKEYAVVFIPSFSNFELPKNIFLGLGIMFLTTFLLHNFNLINSFEVILNLIVLTIFVFFVQGISVIDYKLKEKRIKIGWRVFLIILILDFIPIIGLLAILLGLFDVIFDFRKLRSSN